MTLKLRPLGDRVVVKFIEQEETFAGGQFLLPETAQEKPQQGEVIAVGPGNFDEDGEKRIPMDVNVGDRVLFAKYSGAEIKLSGEKLLILKQSDVLAVIEEED